MKVKNRPFQAILSKLRIFRDQRDWMQFHNPKDMAVALSVEASELLELFLWKDKTEAENLVNNPKELEKVKEELADIFAYSLELADNLDLDIEEIIVEKLKKNAKKYPVEKAKGNARKYNQL